MPSENSPEKWLVSQFFNPQEGSLLRDFESLFLPRVNSCLAAKFKLYWPSGKPLFYWVVPLSCSESSLVLFVRFFGFGVLVWLLTKVDRLGGGVFAECGQAPIEGRSEGKHASHMRHHVHIPHGDVLVEE